MASLRLGRIIWIIFEIAREIEPAFKLPEKAEVIFVNALGDAGRRARSAVGMCSLPNCVRVKIEAIVRIAIENSHVFNSHRVEAKMDKSGSS